MKKFYNPLFVCLFMLPGLSLFSFSCKQQEKQGLSIMENENEYDNPDKAALFQKLRTKDPATGKIPVDKMWEAILETRQQKNRMVNSRNGIEALSWTERGPNTDVVGPSNGNTRPGNGKTSGRIDAIWVDLSDATGKTVWIGADAGGVWKTNDITASPANWTLVNDFFGNLFISAIAQDPTNPDIMYFSTGEAYYNGEDGIGVFKSTDHGVNWTLLPSTSSYIYSSKMICDAVGNVYLATRNFGLVRSSDKGVTWTNITPTGMSNRICDLEISNTGRMHLVAGISSTQLYRYTDNPATVSSAAGWVSPVTTFTSGTQRAEIGVSGNTLYAIPSINNEVPTVWKSVDGGANWNTSGTPPVTATGKPFANNQGYYNLAVAVNPANPNECIIGGIDNAKTTDGGTTWNRISNWVGTTGQYVHADQHTSVWYDNGNKLLFGTDGGIHYSSDGGLNIQDRNVNLRLKEFYSCAIHPSLTNYFLAGSQDNGTHQLTNAGLSGSVEVLGGDGGYVAIDQNEPQFQTAAIVFTNFRRSTNAGASWISSGSDREDGQFINPYDYDNINNKVYAGTDAGQYLRWENPQTGFTLTPVSFVQLNNEKIAAVTVSPFTANRVYFGTERGTLVRADAADATPNGVTLSTGAGMPAAYMNCINTGGNENNLVVSFSNYNITNVWVSTNAGTSWTGIDGNLPNMPVYWALFHPDDNKKMIIATETGVWETDLINDGGTIWYPSPNFPTVRTYMLKYRSSDRSLLAATYGRGLWTSTLAAPSNFDLGTPAAATSSCPASATMSITLPTISNSGFVNPITFTATGNPAGTFVTFSPATVIPGNPVTVTLNNSNTLSPGSYIIAVKATATGAPDVTRNLTYIINPGTDPAITTLPVSQMVCDGRDIAFTVAGTGSFQWQVNNGSEFVNVLNVAPYNGANTNTLTITGATTSMNGFQYRVLVTGACPGTVNSSAATLTVVSPVTISTQPVNAEQCSGTAVSFTVAGSGPPTINYQWQVSTNAGGAWTNITGANNAVYNIPAVAIVMNGNLYRALISNNTCTAIATSNAASLTVRQLPVVSLSSTEPTMLLPGLSATLTAMPSVSTGGVLSVSWTRNNNPITVAGNSLLVNMSNLGAYQVKIQEAWPGGLFCSSLSQVITIDASASNKLYIFPSPNNGNFTVTYFNAGTGNSRQSISVYDAKGSKVFSGQFTGAGPYTLIPVNLENAGRGIYFVVVGDVNGKKVAEGKVHVR